MAARQGVSIVGWAVVGAALTVVAVAALRGYIMVSHGYSLRAVPLTDLLFRVMALHEYALYGAGGGAVMGLLEMTYRWFRDRECKPREQYREMAWSPDDVIKHERTRRAEAYLQQKALESSGEEPPRVENVITARDGQLTYRLLAYRALSEEEMMEVVRAGLSNGSIVEPAPGTETVVTTAIGRDRSG